MDKFKKAMSNFWFEIKLYLEIAGIVLLACVGVAVSIILVIVLLGACVILATSPIIIIMYAAKMIFGG